jgi:hypothetical protein
MIIKKFSTVYEAVIALHSAISTKIAEGLKDLFQNKHLYQNVKIELDELKELASPPGTDSLARFIEMAQPHVIPKISGPWFPIQTIQLNPALSANDPISFSTPDVKLFCKNCDRIEAFNSISTEDVLYPRTTDYAGFRTKRGTVQVFAFSFLCQACKIAPEVFIVRREDLRLILCGRAPIEHIPVPDVIPKNIRKFYSGAILAYQSGQTLAGIFLLRTLIEQWAQSKSTQKGLQADQAIDAYMGTLPDDFKARFPSLRVLYGDLSTDIHTATGSSDLFEKASKQIDEHFEARRLFKLDNPL